MRAVVMKCTKILTLTGSSAGAGSGEFHVYRQIRRKEMFRTRILDKEREKEELDDAFQVGTFMGIIT